MKHAKRTIIVAIAIGLGGCDRLPWQSKSTPQEPTTTQAGPNVPSVPSIERVAQINTTPISTTDMELAIQEVKRYAQAYHQEWKPLSTEELPNELDLHDVLENLVATELKAQDARARGLDRKTEFERRLAYVTRSLYAQEWDRWQQEQAAATEEEIHKFYDENKTGFVDPERVKIRQIVTETLSEAEAVRAKAVQGEGFEQLAKGLSIGAGREKGGEVGWYVRAVDQQRLQITGNTEEVGVLFPQLEPLVFALEIGQVSQPVKGPDNHYYVVQVSERRSAKQKTELEVHDMISELLRLQKVQQRLEELRSKSKIERFPERLSGVTQ